MLNALGKVENAEAGVSLQQINVLDELHRLAQRQFEWQRGFLLLSNLYRSSFIYGGSLARSEFERIRQMSLDTFVQACFSVGASLTTRPFLDKETSFEIIGLSREAIAQTWQIISLPIEQARSQAIELRSKGGQIAYRPSLLRKFPCIAFGSSHNIVIAPLPTLVMLRSTAGIFYDLVTAHTATRNEIGGRFEIYVADLLRTIFSHNDIRRSFKYNSKNGEVDSPDISVVQNNKIAAIVECKALKMTFEARFGDYPLRDAKSRYDELVRGVIQIWKYRAHVRLGIAPVVAFSENAIGLIVTLDSWLMMSKSMQQQIVKQARLESVEKFPMINEVDRISVSFCPIDDLEILCARATPSSLIDTFVQAASEQLIGWMLWNVHDEIAPGPHTNKPYPFRDRVAEVVPWWGQMASRMGRNPVTFDLENPQASSDL
ncbi:hypothetical protein MKK88_24075 [Methylobacterium sp. E-005]|uniref:hypothetical protein n=1 Tax=Methylobacterium sp. E-005 TaxID=2836549 RepID=UPI001FBBEB3E|nr:hypothetical protein [Methylobacterium sp. E-005]MCJ2089038.1 hypothetical protein [Methylobacterium sp. E-005]